MQNDILPAFTQLAPLRSAKLFRIYLAIEECSRLCRLSWFYLAALVGVVVAFLAAANQAVYPGDPIFPVVMVVMACTIFAFGWCLYTVGALHLRGARMRTQLRIADIDSSPDTPAGVAAEIDKISRGLVRVQLVLKACLGVALGIALLGGGAFLLQAADSLGLGADEALTVAPPPPPPPAPPPSYYGG